MFLDSHGSPIETVEAKENDTVVLICSSNSSNTLELYCDKNITHKIFNGVKPRVEIKADRWSNGKECSCHDLTNGVDKYQKLNILGKKYVARFTRT